MTQEHREHAWLPPERAFGVQFYADIVPDTRHMAGRVEHVVSGHVGYFHSLAGPLSFISSRLAERETVRDAEG